ncbi:MAG: diacylglycerol kinase family protein [Sphingobacteriales bacterium]|nr:diacylglycerol kinase family protein [Sphingobacteriales bacterium]
MKKKQPFSWKARGRSFGYAWQGLLDFFLAEPNALLHALTTVAVTVLILFFRISGGELLALVAVTGLVWITELLNSAVEKMMDLVSPEWHPKVKYIKDVAAAAVLVAAGTALLTGCLVFIPKL